MKTTKKTKYITLMREEFGERFLGDHLSRGIFSTDASIYMQKPHGILYPKNSHEVRKAVQLSRENSIPILVRGGGTSLAGQTTARGALVIDVSRYMNRIGHLDADEKTIIVEPGVVRDELNRAIASEGLMFAPETSTSNRANIGGMIANNSSGMMSIRYGTTIDHVVALEVLLPNGEIEWVGPRDSMTDRGKAWLNQTESLLKMYEDLILEKTPDVIRRVGGYTVDRILNQDNPNLASLFVGSEGTLGIILRAKLKLVPQLKEIALLAIHFKSLEESLRAVPEMVKTDPLSIEFMDQKLLRLCKTNPSTMHLISWLKGDPEAVLAVEFEHEKKDVAQDKAIQLETRLKEAGFHFHSERVFEPWQRKEVLESRKLGLGVMSRVKEDAKPISFIEDACVPVDNLADYVREVYEVLDKENVPVVTYGHASVGVLHIKPALDLKKTHDRKKCRRISRQVMEICRKYKGSWSGEHGDGIARGAYNEEFWGKEMITVFRSIKKLYDSEGLLNPGKIYDTPSLTGPLRYTQGYEQSNLETVFKFSEEGDLQKAVEMCNGVGACRKTGSGTMCPSYMATRDERHSTRGRANALRLTLSGQYAGGDFSSPELYKVLDLCLECKACKTECPNAVDMSKMKSEFLHHWHKKNGAKLRERVFANSPLTASLISGPLAELNNRLLAQPLIKRLLSSFLGIAPKRNLPTYASEKFETWFVNEGKAGQPSKPIRTIALFADTYIRYHEPQLGKWAVRVLQSLGYKVLLARAGCCGRPWISKGFLDKAATIADSTLRDLSRYVNKGVPIITIEPSCHSSLLQDLPDLSTLDYSKDKMNRGVYSFEDFIAAQIDSGELTLQENLKGTFLFHGHCHQKSMGLNRAVHRVFSSAGEKVTLQEVDSGCCGMAGSFGYEKEHYEISMKLANDRLFPAIDAAGDHTTIIANGFSCRHQIKDGRNRDAVHVAEALGRALQLPDP